jgi:NodT family efflux transporter outer membrane factor (OMF) lipoprotein
MAANIKNILFILTLTIFLSSCGIITKTYKEPDKSLYENLYRDKGNDNNDTTNIANVPWQQLFTDEVLQDLIEEGLSNNIDLNIALERINEANASLYQSKLLLFPKLNGTAGTSQKKLSDNTTLSDNLKSSIWEAGLNVSWELDLWGKLSSAKRASLASMLKTEAAGRLVKTEVIANIAKLYYTLLALDKKLQITLYTVEIREKDVNSMMLMKESGKVNGAALVQSQANLYSAQVSIPDIKQSIRETENALCIILGRIPGSIQREKLENQKTDIDLLTGIPGQLIANRPDVQASELALREAFENVNVAKASFYPTISITANGGLSSVGIKDFLDKSVFYNLIGNLVQPIFNAGQNKSKFEIAKARQREAFLDFRKSLLNAGTEVSDALYSYQMAVEKEASREKQINALQNAVSFTKELLMYSSNTDYTDVLMSEQSLLNAQLSSVNDKTQKLDAIVNLYKALGGGWK